MRVSLLRVAVHEAGHALVGAFCGLRVDAVEVYAPLRRRPDGCFESGLCRTSGWESRPPWAGYGMALAGSAAESLFYAAPAPLPAADRACAAWHFRRSGFEPRDAGSYWPRLAEILGDRLRAVPDFRAAAEAVAAELIARRGELPGAAFRAAAASFLRDETLARRVRRECRSLVRPTVLV